MLLSLCIVLSLCTSTLYCNLENADIRFLLTFFQHKRIHLVHYYTSSNLNGTLNLLKLSFANNLRVSTVENSRVGHKLDYFFHTFSFVIDVENYLSWQVVLRHKMKNIKFRVQQYGLLLCRSPVMFVFVKDKLKNFYLRVDSNLYVAIKIGNGNYHVYEFYNPGYRKGGSLQFYNSFNYTQSLGVIVRNANSIYEMRKDLSSAHLRVVFVVTRNVAEPLEYLKDQRTKQFDTSSKVNFGIFGHMIDIHKYSWTVVVTPAWFGSGHLGVEIGLANVLTRDLADISGSSGLMTPGRVEAFDFGVGTYLFRTSFIFRNPYLYDDDDAGETFILKPFSKSVWFCTGLFATVLAVSLKLVFQFEGSLLKSSNNLSLCTVGVFTMAAFCQQGTNLHYKSVCGRILLLQLLIFAYVLYNYYTSSIVSSVINSQKKTFSDLEELVNSDLDIGIERIAYARVLNATNNPILFYLNGEANGNSSRIGFETQSEGIQKIREGNFAYVAETITAYNDMDRTFSNEEICEMVELDAAKPTLIYIVGKKNGQYNELFSISYRRMAQYGLLERQQKIFSSQKPHCLNAVQFVQVGFGQLASAFLLLLVGFSIALIVLLIEIVHFRILRDSDGNSQQAKLFCHKKTYDCNC